MNCYRSSHDVVTTFRLHTAMRSTVFKCSYKAGCLSVIGWFSTAVIGEFRYSLLVRCSLGGPRSYGSLDRGHPRFWNFYSTVTVEVVRVKSSLILRVKHWRSLKRRRSGYELVGCVSVVLVYSVLYWSSCLADVNFAIFTGNPVKQRRLVWPVRRLSCSQSFCLLSHWCQKI